MMRIKTLRGGALAALLLFIACSDFGGFRLRASDLQIGPNPAMPGDQMVASFILFLVPVQSHIVVLTINGTEHSRITSSDAPPIPYVIELGDAADLIATYGVGTHAARIQVHAQDADETARTSTVSFELREAAAP